MCFVLVRFFLKALVNKIEAFRIIKSNSSVLTYLLQNNKTLRIYRNHLRWRFYFVLTNYTQTILQTPRTRVLTITSFIFVLYWYSLKVLTFQGTSLKSILSIKEMRVYSSIAEMLLIILFTIETHYTIIRNLSNNMLLFSTVVFYWIYWYSCLSNCSYYRINIYTIYSLKKNINILTIKPTIEHKCNCIASHYVRSYTTMQL